MREREVLNFRWGSLSHVVHLSKLTLRSLIFDSPTRDSLDSPAKQYSSHAFASCLSARKTFESLQSRPQGYLTLAHQDMETIKLLPPTFAVSTR